MSLRLSKACKELNVAMTTAVEFLEQNGIYVSLNPNLKLADEIYLLLANEFNKDIAIKIESDRLNVERINEKKNQPFNIDVGNYKQETIIDNGISINEITNSKSDNKIDKTSIIMENN